MKITGLIWLDNVIEKIEIKHHVTMTEIEEVFVSKPKVKKMRRGRFRGEHVYRALGQTESGRYLTVFFIHKLTHEALILSARNMDKKERKSYDKK
ncbi:BrnT family toxin [candidate division KSB1 bacterium]|nr:BrnT family toxin [candidate division KSB1 bacterium]